MDDITVVVYTLVALFVLAGLVLRYIDSRKPLPKPNLALIDAAYRRALEGEAPRDGDRAVLDAVIYDFADHLAATHGVREHFSEVPAAERVEFLIAASRVAIALPDEQGGWPMRMEGREGLADAIRARPDLGDPHVAFACVMGALSSRDPALATELFYTVEAKAPELAPIILDWAHFATVEFPELNEVDVILEWLGSIAGYAEEPIA